MDYRRKVYALRQVRGAGDGWPACCPHGMLFLFDPDCLAPFTVFSGVSLGQAVDCFPPSGIKSDKPECSVLLLWPRPKPALSPGTWKPLLGPGAPNNLFLG